MIGDRISVIMKGSSLFGVNFGLATFHFRFRASNHTLSPFLNGVKCCLVLAAMVCLASSWAARASRWAAWRFLSCSLTVGNGEDGRTVGKGTGS